MWSIVWHHSMNSTAQKAQPFKCSLVQNTPMYILGNHLICIGTPGISTMWLRLFNSRSGYHATTIPKAQTEGTNARQTNTQARHRPAAPCYTGTQLDTVYFELRRDTHHLKVLGETRQSDSVRLSNSNLLTGNGRKRYNKLFHLSIQ